MPAPKQLEIQADKTRDTSSLSVSATTDPLLQQSYSDKIILSWLKLYRGSILGAMIRGSILGAIIRLFVGPVMLICAVIATTTVFHFKINSTLLTVVMTSLFLLIGNFSATTIQYVLQGVEQRNKQFIGPTQFALIEAALQKYGVAKLADLSISDASIGMRLLEEYAKEHSSEQLRLKDKGRALAHKNEEQVAKAWKNWQEIMQDVQAGRVPCSDKVLLIVNLLAEAISAPARTETDIMQGGEFMWTNLDIRLIFDSVKMPSQLPVLLYTQSYFGKADMDKLHFLMQDHIVCKSRVALFLVFGEDGSYVKTVSSSLEELNKIYAYDVLATTYNDLLAILVAKEPHQAFRRHVLSHLDLARVSPFVTSGPTPDHMFFGRERELREISENVSIANYALIGGRRIGKTSILKHLEHRILPLSGFRALFHDCSYTPTMEELICALSMDRAWFPVPSPDVDRNAPNATAEAVAASPVFNTLSELIQALPDDKPLVILLDEADKLIAEERRRGYPIFNTLRALANAGRCHFVLSGEQALQSELANTDSPLYNFANTLVVTRLEFAAVQKLVTRPFAQLEITLNDEAQIVQRVWDFTGGHPAIVQSLCQRLIAHLNSAQQRTITLADVERLVTDLDFLRNNFLNIYWERATNLERLCSLVMAAQEPARTLTTIHEILTQQGLEVTLNQVDGALERLVVLRNILQATKTGYSFAVTAFPEVIGRTARLNDLIALYSESYRDYGDVDPNTTRVSGGA